MLMIYPMHINVFLLVLFGIWNTVLDSNIITNAVKPYGINKNVLIYIEIINLSE